MANSSTLSKFGIPVSSTTGRGGLLQPKVKWKFRVIVVSFGPIAGGLELTQQVQSCGRPQNQQEAVAVHAYNSVAYYAGKSIWQPIELTVRDDITNSVSALIGHQMQKQMNHFEQTSDAAGINYKFQMEMDTMAGGDDDVLETWNLEGCFIESANWDSFDYAQNEPMTIQMSVRYDNATQADGLFPLVTDSVIGSTIG